MKGTITSSPETPSAPTFKSVRPKAGLPPLSIPLAALKPLEREIQQRNHILAEPEAPLWFLAETERNMFLWKTGHSLTEQDEFEFWVDVPALVARRIHQLNESCSDYVIESCSTLDDPADRSPTDPDARYLAEFLDLCSSALPQLHMLHRVGPSNPAGRALVLLPGSGNRGSDLSHQSLKSSG